MMLRVGKPRDRGRQKKPEPPIRRRRNPPGRSIYMRANTCRVMAPGCTEIPARFGIEQGPRSESAPENRGAPFNVRQCCLRGLLLDFDSLAVADRDRARLPGLGDLAHQVDVQETVLEARAFHQDEVGELEHALEGARRDALIEHLAALAFVPGVFLAADGQRVLFGYDGKLRLIEARDRDRYAVRILAGPLDIVGRITGSGALEALIEQREQPVEADGGTIKGS